MTARTLARLRRMCATTGDYVCAGCARLRPPGTTCVCGR